MTKAMIVSVGGTPAPIIKSILEHKPEFVSFFASQQTAEQAASIKADVTRSGMEINAEYTLTDNVNDLFHCHEKAEEAVQRVLKKGYQTKDVIVDYTGGTKNMSVALSLAAITHGFSFSYVGGTERTKGGGGIVVNGKEQVYPNINPWDFLAMEERKKISLLFNSYQFGACRTLIDALAGKNVKYASAFRKLGHLVEGFHKWDLFRHAEALESFKRGKLPEFRDIEDSGLKAFAAKCAVPIETLEGLLAESDKGRKPSRRLIADLYANAERRAGEAKWDDAILRLYRLVEMIAQERLLASYAIDVSDVKPDQIPAVLRASFQQDYRDARQGKIKIPQAACFRLLESLGDDLGKTFRTKETSFRNVQSARNNSYLAHGFQSSKESIYASLKEFVLLLNAFCLAEAPEFPEMTL